MGLYGGKNPPEREYHLPKPPPRIDWPEMTKELTNHLGEEVTVGKHTGILNRYGCLTCDNLFTVVAFGREPFTFHPGDVYKVRVTKFHDGTSVTIELCQEI